MSVSREHVYLRLFSDEMNRAIKRRKPEEPLCTGNPSFSFRRVRLFGVVVNVEPHAENGSFLTIDDATGVARVFCQGFAHEKASSLSKGSSVELFAHVNADNQIVADNLRDNSNEPFADVMSMLETMDAYQKYFSVQLAPIEPGGWEDLSPFKRRPVDAAQIERLVSGAAKGISLAQLSSTVRADEQEVLAVLQNLMESGLCYNNKDMYFPL